MKFFGEIMQLMEDVKQKFTINDIVEISIKNTLKTGVANQMILDISSSSKIKDESQAVTGETPERNGEYIQR